MPIPQSGEQYLRLQADPNQVSVSVDREDRSPDRSPVSSPGKSASKYSLSEGSPLNDLQSVLSGSSRKTAKSSNFNNIAYKDCKWDFFLCCTPQGRNAILHLHEALPERFEGAKVWLDEQHDPSDATLVDGICNSRNILVFLTAGSTSEAKWQHQMRVAMGAKRNFVLLGETDEMHGKPSIDELIAKCPTDLKPLFNDNVIIPYFSDPDFRSVTFEKMSRVLALDPEESMQESKALAKERKDLFFKKVIVHDLENETEAVLSVFPTQFVNFATFCGLLLPGHSSRAKMWSRFVQVFIVVCMLLCTTRFFTPEGPGFIDYLSVAQIVALHPVLLLMLFVMPYVFRGTEVQKLTMNEIESSVEAKALHVKLEYLTIAAIGLTALFSIWGWISYLPGFWTTYYIESNRDEYMAFGIIGFLHGVAWIVALPVVFGIVFCVSIMAFALQEIGYMGLVSAFNELHPEIASAGLHALTAHPAGMNVKDGDLYRFQMRFLRCWSLYRWLQWKAAMPWLAFWVAQVCLLAWSAWSLFQGFDAVIDERTMRLRAHWHLTSRLTWLIGASPWFGLAGYLVGLLPWGANFYASKIAVATRRIFFTNTNLRICFTTFMEEFDLEFRVLFLQATPWFFLLAVAIMGVNTAGYIADVSRLLSGV